MVKRRSTELAGGWRFILLTSTRVCWLYLIYSSVCSFNCLVVLKQVHPDIGISSNAMAVLNLFLTHSSMISLNKLPLRPPVSCLHSFNYASVWFYLRAWLILQEVHYLIMWDPNFSPTYPSQWTCHVHHFARYQVSQQMYTTLPWCPCLHIELFIQSCHLVQIRLCVSSGDFALDTTVFLPAYIWILCALYSEYINWDCKLNACTIICITTHMYIYFRPIFCLLLFQT